MNEAKEKRSEFLQRLLSVEEAGALIGLGKWRIRTLIYRGELPYVRVGRRVMVDVRDIEEFITNHKTREGKLDRPVLAKPS